MMASLQQSVADVQAQRSALEEVCVDWTDLPCDCGTLLEGDHGDIWVT